jgi:competence protein ComEC
MTVNVRLPATAARSRVLAAVLLGIVAGAAATAARTGARDAEPLAHLARDHATVRAELTVTDDPHALSPHGRGPASVLVPARLTALAGEDSGPVRLDARVVVFASDPAWRRLLPGQRLAVTGRLAPNERSGGLTAAVLQASGAPELQGRPPWPQRAAGRLRAGLQRACDPLPDGPGGLLPGLVIGDTSRLDPALEEQFRATGLTHLVAVSGANVAVTLGVVLFVARRCRAGPRTCAAACGVARVGFVILARPSPSVVRAAAMGTVGLAALVAGRPQAAAPALAVAVLAGLVIDPVLATDPGFALSVLATGGLVLLAPRWRDALRARGVPAGVAEALAVPAAAQAACAPLIAILSGTVSLVAVPANLLAVPAVAPATVLGVGSALVSPLWPDGAEFVAWLASWPARWLVAIAGLGAGLPLGTISGPGGAAGGLLLAAATVGVLLAPRRVRTVVAVVAVAMALGAVPVRLLDPGWPPPGAVVVACDVGQGDAIVLPTGPGEAVVVDAGPDPAAVDSCLRALGITAVPLLLFTHQHVDHVAGLAGVLRGRTVTDVVIGAFDEPVAGERAVREAAASVREVGAGWSYRRGPLSLLVLAPVRPITGTRSDPNNNSLIVRVDSGGTRMLLAGDAETEEQHALLAEAGPAALRADVLKVAHHGSAYQDADLLAAVDPVVALVSVGVDNPYGHPNPALLGSLARDGARVLRTDVDGDLAVIRTSTGIGVATHHRA